ncbi:MAG: type II toxin-antitoxin system HicA family toxin [Anaerolineae bacterium]
MPKLPLISGQQVVRTLERLGFEKARQRGSHVVLRRYTSSGKRACVVPMHREIQIGTLMEILRQADVTSEEFLRNL